MVIFLESRDNSTKFLEVVDIFYMPLRGVAFGTNHVAFYQFHHIVPTLYLCGSHGGIKIIYLSHHPKVLEEEKTCPASNEYFSSLFSTQ